MLWSLHGDEYLVKKTLSTTPRPCYPQLSPCVFVFGWQKGEFADYNVQKVRHFTRANFGYLWADKDIDSQPLPVGVNCHSKY